MHGLCYVCRTMNTKNSKSELDIFKVDTSSSVELPFVEEGIRAGFPSPAQDYLDLSIDLNHELVKHPSTTFYGRVKGDSLLEADIHDGDLLIIDKSLEPRNGDLAVCCVDGEFTLKYIQIEQDVVWLIPANKEFQPIKVTAGNEFIIWGIVTYSIKKHRNTRR